MQETDTPGELDLERAESIRSDSGDRPATRSRAQLVGRTVLFLGKSETFPPSFDALAFSRRHGHFAALASSCRVLKSDTVEIPGIGTRPLVHISRIGHGAWADAQVVSLLNDKESVSLLLSSEIPANRITVLRLGALDNVVRLETDVVTTQSDWLALKDCHRGRRAFVLGNGPSLLTGDLSRLHGEITFGSNKIYLAFDETDWRPTYYTVCDELVARNNAEAISAVGALTLLPRTLMRFGCRFTTGLWYDERYENGFVCELDPTALKESRLLFSRDVRYGVHGGYSVVYHQLQLAYFMGIREIYLLGVDFRFVVPDTVTDDPAFTSATYRNALVSGGEVNHFHKDYRKPGETWSMPRLDLQLRAFTTARQVFESSGGHLVNASRRTALTALPRADFNRLWTKPSVDYAAAWRPERTSTPEAEGGACTGHGPPLTSDRTECPPTDTLTACTKKATILLCTPNIQSDITKQCLDSLCKHTNPQLYRLIVADNQWDEGFSHPHEMNRCLTGLDTEYLVSIDDDVILSPGWLDALLEVAERDPSVGAVGCVHTFADGSINHTGGALRFADGSMRHKHGLRPIRDVKFTTYACSACLLLRKSSLVFSESYAKYYFELDYCLRLWETGLRVAVSPHRICHLREQQIRRKLDQNSGRVKEAYKLDEAVFSRIWYESGRLNALYGRIKDELNHPDMEATALPESAVELAVRGPVAMAPGTGAVGRGRTVDGE